MWKRFESDECANGVERRQQRALIARLCAVGDVSDLSGELDRLLSLVAGDLNPCREARPCGGWDSSVLASGTVVDDVVERPIDELHDLPGLFPMYSHVSYVVGAITARASVCPNM